MVRATYRIEFGQEYRALVMADSPKGYWRLGETSGTNADDETSNNNDGTYVNSPTLGATGAIVVDFNTAATFAGGSSQRVTIGNIGLFRFAGAFSIEAWIAFTSTSLMSVVSKLTGIPSGYALYVETGKVRAIAYTAGGSTMFNPVSTNTYNDGLYHHCVLTWDGTTGVNGVKLYVDTVLVSQVTSSAAAPVGDGGTDVFQLAADQFGADFFTGTIDEVAVYNTVLSPTRISAHYAAAAWLNLTPDIVNEEGAFAKRGIIGGGPTDRIANPGTLQFTLRNDIRNSGSTQGWYSPNHASHREGWTFGLPIRLVVNYSATDYVVWRGRIRTINPLPGLAREQRVLVTAQDCIGDLSDTNVREISPQINQTENQLLATVVAAMPSSARAATSFDTGLDTYPFAFDDIAGGASALRLVSDVVMSALGKLYPKANGTLRYTNRQTLAAMSSVGTFSGSDIRGDDGLQVPSSLALVYNRVRGTIHQKTVDAAATTVLAALSVASAATPSTTIVQPGQSVTIWLNYFDPSNTLKLIGGTAQVTPIVATTDYLANSASDGSGSNLTANIAVTTTAFSASAKFVITNNGSGAAYITKLQIRGKGIYDNSPLTVESFTAQNYGDRPLEIDLRYQNSASVAQEFCDYLKTLYISLANEATYVGLNPQQSNALMLHALQREIGEIITVSEPVTGLASVLLTIQGVEMEVREGLLRCGWWVAPALTSSSWILDDAVASVLDTTTVLGYA